MIDEGKRLHKLGFSILWLKPNSKAPIEAKWTSGPRKTWGQLQDQYRYGYNFGVRFGKTSKFEDGTYLAVIDCDVKSPEKKHLKEMEAKLKELLPTFGRTPQVSSGRGNGSRHIYIRTVTPIVPFRFSQSPEKVRVLMPSLKKFSGIEQETLSAADMKEGWHLRAAWEISVMGEGQQAVLPPSIHPDTGNSYEWAVPLTSFQDIPIVSLGSAPRAAKDEVVQDFNAIDDVDLVSSDLPDSSVALILNGAGCEDKSAALFTACIAMVKARFSDDEILSVLTDKDNFLGEAAYRHANTQSRKRAAEWVRRYTLAKVKDEISAENDFDGDVVETKLEKKEAAKQRDKFVGEQAAADGSWQLKIERQSDHANAKPKPTLKNITWILSHAIHAKLFCYDPFSIRTAYAMRAPWGGTKGQAITDIDPVLIKGWLAEHHRFEPTVNTIWEAIHLMAQENTVHPIKEYLNGLPKWDGEERLGIYLKKYFGATAPDFYLSEVFTTWMVAAVRRIFEPGTKHDWMLILEGIQGIGKSSLIEILAGQKYFIDKLPALDDKDAAQVLQGIWLVEMGELKELRKNELETVKGFISRRVDKYRPSYGRASIEAPRQCLFAGSTNASQYLKDDTGNRRFIPVHLGTDLHFKAVERDRDQLWAEALIYYRNEIVPNSILSKPVKAYLKQAHAERMTTDDSDVMMEQILDFLHKQESKSDGEKFDLEKFKMMDLFEGVGPLAGWRHGGWNYQLAAKALRRIGGNTRFVRGSTYWKIEKSPHPAHPTKEVDHAKQSVKDLDW